MSAPLPTTEVERTAPPTVRKRGPARPHPQHVRPRAPCAQHPGQIQQQSPVAPARVEADACLLEHTVRQSYASSRGVALEACSHTPSMDALRACSAHDAHSAADVPITARRASHALTEATLQERASQVASARRRCKQAASDDVPQHINALCGRSSETPLARSPLI